MRLNLSLILQKNNKFDFILFYQNMSNIYDLNCYVGIRDNFMSKYFELLPVDCKLEIFKKRCGLYFKYLKLLNNYDISKDNAYFDDDNEIKYKETKIINHNGQINLYYRFYKNMFIPKNMLPKLKYMQIGDRIIEQKFYKGLTHSIFQQDKVENTYVFLGFIDLYNVNDNISKLSSCNKVTNNKQIIKKTNIEILKLTKELINTNEFDTQEQLNMKAMILARPLKDFECIEDISDFKIIVSDFIAMYYHLMQPSIVLNNKYNLKKIFDKI